MYIVCEIVFCLAGEASKTKRYKMPIKKNKDKVRGEGCVRDVCACEFRGWTRVPRVGGAWFRPITIRCEIRSFSSVG